MGKLNTPICTIANGILSWPKIAHADGYYIYKNGAVYQTVMAPTGVSITSLEVKSTINTNCTVDAYYDDTAYETINVIPGSSIALSHIVKLVVHSNSLTELNYTMNDVTDSLQPGDELVPIADISIRINKISGYKVTIIGSADGMPRGLPGIDGYVNNEATETADFYVGDDGYLTIYSTNPLEDVKYIYLVNGISGKYTSTAVAGWQIDNGSITYLNMHENAKIMIDHDCTLTVYGNLID